MLRFPDLVAGRPRFAIDHFLFQKQAELVLRYLATVRITS